MTGFENFDKTSVYEFLKEKRRTIVVFAVAAMIVALAGIGIWKRLKQKNCQLPMADIFGMLICE